MPSCLEVVGGGGLQDFSVSPSPLRTNLGFELGWTWLGLGLGGLGPGLDIDARCELQMRVLIPRRDAALGLWREGMRYSRQ